MKINNVIRLAYINSEPLYKRLENDVRDRLKAAAEARRWFFIYRVKTLESFAMKIETGRVTNPSLLEDFFACTIVVPTINDIAVAEEFVYDHYDKLVRRPTDPLQTHKKSSSFEFDDLRLYVKRKTGLSSASEDLNDLVFEIQIKTVLQYAWSVATHDLIYKTDAVSWTKERIAFQVKAMLEHAELAISEAPSLATAKGFDKKDTYTSEITELIVVIQKIWEEDFLPSDMKRLSENISNILRVVGVTPTKLDDILHKEIVRNGILPSDLSPYAFIVQALANNREVDLISKLKTRRKFCLLMHSGMDLPKWCSTHPQCIWIGPKGE